MFLVSDEKIISANMTFFKRVVRLIEKGAIDLYLYEEWKAILLQMPMRPFPIFVDKIDDPRLAEQVLLLNQSFSLALSKHIKTVDIDSCEGEQEILEPQQLLDDEKYFELCHVLISSCYNPIDFDTTIIVGPQGSKLQEGYEFDIRCKCPLNSYEKHYCLGSLQKFESQRDLAFERLEELCYKLDPSQIVIPEVKRAHHHNPLQSANIKKFDDIERSSRKVLNFLKSFGLYKIILGEFHNDSSEAAGTIVLKERAKGHKSDIIKGWLYFKGGMKSNIELYFSQGMGYALFDYTDGVLEYTTVLNLKEKLGL